MTLSLHFKLVDICESERKWSCSLVSDSLRPRGLNVAHQAPPSMGFSRQEYWSGLPVPSPGIFLTQGSNPGLPHCRRMLYPLSHQGSLDICEFHFNLKKGSWNQLHNAFHHVVKGPSSGCRVLSRQFTPPSQSFQCASDTVFNNKQESSSSNFYPSTVNVKSWTLIIT